MVDLVIDPGHGGSDYGAKGKNSLVEKYLTLYISNRVKEYLEQKQLSVIMTRNEDKYVTLEERAKIANKNKAKCFISIHVNSAGVPSAEGTEVYTFSKGGEGEKLAENVLGKMVSNLNLKNRGIKFANFTVLKETEMPSILIEVCFISNVREEALLNEEDFRNKVALCIANGLLRHIGREEIAIDSNISITTVKTPILSLPTALKSQAFKWAEKNGATDEFIALAELYWESSVIGSGVNPVVAYAQSAFETDFGHFKGSLKRDYKNPCGLKMSNGTEEENGGYAVFNNWTSGVEAHLDHLALYAGGVIYPKGITRDPRHFPYLYGRARYVEDLSENWSPTDNYGMKILELIKQMETTYAADDITPITIDDFPVKENLDKDVEGGNDTGIDRLKKEVSYIIADIEKLRDRTNELKAYIKEIEGFLAQEKRLKEALSDTNMSLQERNRNYEQTIEDILNIISKIKNII